MVRDRYVFSLYRLFFKCIDYILGSGFLLFKFVVKDFMEDRELKNIFIYIVDCYIRIFSEFYDFCLKDEFINVE